MCTEGRAQWERPTTLEELIPYDVRQRFNIKTSTAIEFPLKRGALGTEVELSLFNELIIPDDYTHLKEFIDTHKIKVEKITKESLANCRKAVKKWGAERGYRVVMNHSVPLVEQS